MKQKRGFTLAELLIALVILGVIATFTIPKVLTSQTDAKYNAAAKEAIGMVSGAYEAYKQSNTVSTTMHIADLTPYMNYVSVDTTGGIDREYGATGSWTCSNVSPCLRLHNGVLLNHYKGNGGATNGNYFGQTQNDHYVYFKLDPDGKVTSSGDANGAGKTVVVNLYYNGKIMLLEDCEAGGLTYSDGGSNNWCPGDGSGIPPWFSWK